jgi:hypothetical protein
MVLGSIAVVEEQCPLGHVRRGAQSVRQQWLKVLAHHGKLLGIMAIALLDLIVQGRLRVGLTKQGRAHGASVRATVVVFAAFGDVAAAIKRINKGTIVRQKFIGLSQGCPGASPVHTSMWSKGS